MANSARHHIPLFILLVDSSDEQKSALLKKLTPVQIKAVLEAIVNVLRAYCPLNDKEKKTLIKHRDIICILWFRKSLLVSSNNVY